MIEKVKALVYRLLSIPIIRRIYVGTNRATLAVAGSSRLASHAYHSLNPIPFSREEHAVLAGRKAYYQHLHQPGRSMVQLRRNIHRLEKGLLMEPPRPVFAKDYIGETVEFFEAATADRPEGSPVDHDEIRWARDVLISYFDRVTTDPDVNNWRRRFEATSDRTDDLDSPENHTPRTPYRRDITDPPVSYDAMLALAMQRRSVRWFEQRPVPRDLIDKALLIGRQSPTACNRMPYEIRIFDDPELAQQVAAIPFGAAGYSHNIPVIAVVVGRLDSYFSPRDRHAIYIDASLAAMGFMYGLETVGLSSSVINWPDFEPLERKMQRTLGLELSERPIMLIAMGYHDPKGMVAGSVKKELDTFRSYNRVGPEWNEPSPS